MANKISLNSTKTELIFFRKKNSAIPNIKNIKLNGIKLFPSSKIKYLGLIFDEHLTFLNHINILNAKLKRANNLLAISKHYVPLYILKRIYFGQFHSHLSYGCQIWGYNTNLISKTFTLQKKAVRLMSFADKNAHSDPLFKELKIVKLNDLIKTQNTIFVHKTLNNNSPKHFKNHFLKTKPNHNSP